MRRRLRRTAARARSLAEPRRRAAFVRFADLVQQLGEPAAVQWLPPLPLGRPPEDHLIEWFEKSRDFLFSIPVEVRTLLCREGIEGVDVDTMLADGARIAGLQERLGPGSQRSTYIPSRQDRTGEPQR